MAAARGAACALLATCAHALSFSAAPRAHRGAECDSVRYDEINQSVCVCEATGASGCARINRRQDRCPAGTESRLCTSRGRTVALGSTAKPPQNVTWHTGQKLSQPRRAILFTYPKTASTSLFVSFVKRSMDPVRYHFIQNGDQSLSDLEDCARSRCLVVSTIRKPGPAAISLFFQQHFGEWDKPDRCKARCRKEGYRILNMSSGELREEFFKTAERNLARFYTRPWSQFCGRLLAAGHQLDLAKVKAIGSRPQMDARLVDGNTTWHFLRFDNISEWSQVMQQYVPGWELASHGLDSRTSVYKDQYDELKRVLAEQQAWPVKLWDRMKNSETMQIFYDNENPL